MTTSDNVEKLRYLVRVRMKEPFVEGPQPDRVRDLKELLALAEDLGIDKEVWPYELKHLLKLFSPEGNLDKKHFSYAESVRSSASGWTEALPPELFALIEREMNNHAHASDRLKQHLDQAPNSNSNDPIGSESDPEKTADDSHSIKSDADSEQEPDLKAAFNSALQRGSFSVIIHGVAQSEKSSLIQCLVDKCSASCASSQTEFVKEYRVQGNGSTYLNVIDTAAFDGKSSYREKVLMGIDAALDSCRKPTAPPLKRIYFLLSFEPDRDFIPKRVLDRLQLLLLAYGKENLSRIRFLVCQMDLLQSKYPKMQLMIEYSRIVNTLPFQQENCVLSFQQKSPEILSFSDARLFEPFLNDLQTASKERPLDVSLRPLSIQSPLESPYQLQVFYEKNAKLFSLDYKSLPRTTTLCGLSQAYVDLKVNASQLSYQLRELGKQLDKDGLMNFGTGLGGAVLGLFVPPAGAMIFGHALLNTARNKHKHSCVKDAIAAMDQLRTESTNLHDLLLSLCE